MSVLRVVAEKMRELNQRRGAVDEPAPMPSLEERLKGMRWSIFVCAEPDGQDCDSGTHPNVLRHNCAALRRFHESDGQMPGPRLREVPVSLHTSETRVSTMLHEVFYQPPQNRTVE